MRPFISEFRKLGEKETRVVKVFSRNSGTGLPVDEYAFVEHYCDEKDCDCRRVMISFYADKAEKVLATISMGFDSEGDEAGPFLDPLNIQSEYSKHALNLFLDVINGDPDYLARLQRHYVMFREKVTGRKYQGRPFEVPGSVVRKEKMPSFELPTFSTQKTVVTDRQKLGRNDPCPCGSGKKYKKCCMDSPDRDIALSAPAQSSKRPTITAPPEPTTAADRIASRADMAEAKALVAAAARRVQQKKPESVDESAYERVKRNPLLADAFLELLLNQHALTRNQQEPSPGYLACLFLLELALTELRYSIDSKRPWAIDAAERIQQKMAAKGFTVEVDARVQADLIRVLHEAGLEVHPEIKTGREKLAEYYGRFIGHKRKPDMDALFNDLAPPGSKDPFQLMEPIMAELTLLPEEGQAMVLVEMVQTRNPLIRELAGLMLLYPNREVRIHLPAMYNDLADATSFSPVTLRRMIGLRNWLPEAERPALDGLIRKVRAAHVECAPMPPPRRVATYASPMDGAGSQAIWNIVGQKRNHRMRSVLIKQGFGIRDTMGLEHMDKKEVESLIREMRTTSMSEAVDISYLNDAVPHFIWVGQQQGSPPPAGLLQVAEELGIKYWLPRQVRIEDEIAALEEAIDPQLLSAGRVARVLKESADWPEKKPFASSWFEDDASVDELLKGARGLTYSLFGALPAKAVQAIIDQVVQPKYPVWAERLLWMTLWAKACLDKSPIPWQDLFIVARQFAQSTHAREIPLLKAVAERSVRSGLQRRQSMPS